MSDQCALNESGGLKDAKDIEFFYSESEAMPITGMPLPSSSALKNLGNAGLRRGERKKNAEKMYTSIAAEQLTNKFGAIIKKNLPQRQQPARPLRPAKKLKMDSDVVEIDNVPDDSDPDDGEYESSEDSDGDTEIEEAQLEPSNAEIADILPSKTIPTTGRGSGKRKRDKTTLNKITVDKTTADKTTAVTLSLCDVRVSSLTPSVP